MNVLHDDNKVSVSLGSTIFGERDTRIELVSDSGDRFYISLPAFRCNMDLMQRFSYEVCVMKSNHCQDNNYSEVRLKFDRPGFTRVGYMFPISSAVNPDSKIYDSSNSEYLYGYLIAGIFHLINAGDFQGHEKHISWDETYQLSYFFEDSIVLLCLDKNRLEECDQPGYKYQIYPMLFSRRIYEFVGDYSIRDKHNDEDFYSNSFINIGPVSSFISKEIIDFIFGHMAPHEASDTDYLSRFFIQYQVFEMLMDAVFSSTMKEFIAKSNQPRYAESAWKMKALVAKLNEKVSEGKRISKVCELMEASCKDSIRNSCIELLSEINSKGFDVHEEYMGFSCSESLYAVRNCVFHGYAKYGLSKEKLVGVCRSLSEGIYNIIYSSSSISSSFD